MKIIVDRCVIVSGYTPQEKEKITKKFSIFNPQYRKAKQQNKRTYGVPAFHNYFLIEDVKGFIFLPASAHFFLQEMFPNALLIHKLYFERNESIKLKIKITPRNFQKEAVKVVKNRDRGIFKVPTGGGKTFLASMIIGGFRCNTLIICDTTVIYNQWIELLSRLLKMEIGEIKGKKINILPITVAMSPSLSNQRLKMADHRNYFSMIFVDECQGIGPNNSQKKGETVFESKQYYNRMGRAVQWFTAKKKYGLSDAAIRSDEQGDSIRFALGPVIYETPYGELVEEDAVVKPKLIVRPTEFRTKIPADELSDRYNDLCWELIKDHDRTKMVIRDLVFEEGNHCLILANNKTYIRMIAGGLIEKRPSLAPLIAVITADTPQIYREGYLEMARRGLIKYLFATSLADKGMDVPILDRLFMPFPGKFEGTNKQRLGRVVRSTSGKEGAKVYDYADIKVGVLKGQFLKRFKSSYLERCEIDFDDEIGRASCRERV